MPFSHLSQTLYELEKKSSLVTRAPSAKSCARDTDSLHSCTRLRLVQEMACLYHSCKILPRKHSYPNLIPIINKVSTGPVDKNLKEWAKASKNFALIGILIATASDAHAMDAYYHLVCYTRLREAAFTANRQESKYILHHLIPSSVHRSWPSLSIQKVYSNYQNYGKCIRN